MTDDWVEMSLGGCCEVIKDSVDPASMPPESRYVGMEHLDEGNPNVQRWASPNSVKSLVSRFKQTDSLFGRLRPYLRKVAFANFDGVCSPEILVLRANQEVVNTGFLHLLASSEAAIEHSVAASAGSRMPRTSAHDLLSLKVHVPPLPVQRRIVDLMTHLDAHIANLQAESDALGEAQHVALSEAMRGELATAPLTDDWVRVTLGDIAKWGAGGTPKAGDPRYYEGGTIPWAVISDVQDGYISTTEKRITEAGLEVIGHHAPSGSVLVTMYGTIGRVAITTEALATNQAIAWGIPNANATSSEFMFYWLRNHQPELDRQARGATQRNINRAIIRSTPILLPPLPVQERIVDLMARFEGQHSDLRMEFEVLRALRAAVLSDALAGVMGVPEAYDALLSEVA